MEVRMKRWLPVSILLAGFVAASALAAERPSLRDAPDLTAIRDMIKAEKFTDAIAELDKMVAFGADHADIYNLLGFSHRKSGDLAKAALNYDKALKLDADHTSALEYQGEMFVMMRDMDRARKNLARLVQLCPNGCEERDDLQKAIAAAGN
jgi:Flp pilus assembly protein TadD